MQRKQTSKCSLLGCPGRSLAFIYTRTFRHEQEVVLVALLRVNVDLSRQVGLGVRLRDVACN